MSRASADSAKSGFPGASISRESRSYEPRPAKNSHGYNRQVFRRRLESAESRPLILPCCWSIWTGSGRERTLCRSERSGTMERHGGGSLQETRPASHRPNAQISRKSLFSRGLILGKEPFWAESEGYSATPDRRRRKKKVNPLILRKMFSVWCLRRIYRY